MRDNIAPIALSRIKFSYADHILGKPRNALVARQGKDGAPRARA